MRNEINANLMGIDEHDVLVGGLSVGLVDELGNLLGHNVIR